MMTAVTGGAIRLAAKSTRPGCVSSLYHLLRGNARAITGWFELA
jgi:hypothetical protein